MKIDILTSQGKSGEKKAELRDEVWDAPANDDLVAQALYVYRANMRKGTAHAKTRAEVQGGGIKPWKQKGTGRARQGSIRSPLWVKGGVAFPPRSYKKVLSFSTRMKHKAICCALSDHMRSKSVKVFSSFDSVKEGKTKEMKELMASLAVGGGMSLVIARNEDNRERIVRASRNIPGISVSLPEEVNIFDASKAEYIISIPGAIQVLEDRLLKKK
jgi:large subunit ribosomal protein L4